MSTPRLLLCYFALYIATVWVMLVTLGLLSR